MYRSTPHRKLVLLFAYLALVLLGSMLRASPAAASPTDVFSTLRSAPAHTDLPLGADEGSLPGGRLRPLLSYPSLQLDRLEPRLTQQAEPSPAMPAATEEPQSEFQRLVRQTLGQPLPLFGRDLFSGNTRGFEPVQQVNVPADFIVGPGDEIYIRAWGSVDIDFRATVDRRGAITIPKVGEIPLAGVRFDSLRDHLRGAIARNFHGFELSVSLGQLRSIRVYVTGFAHTPGSYTLSALATPVNALFHAGGPAAAGDLRHIEVHRNGELLTTIDFYRFLQAGAYNNALRLMPEDVIHIPALTAESAIAGAVNRPGIYRLREHETLADLVRFAGGLAATATTHRVVLERFGANDERLIEEFVLDDDGSGIALRHGDLVLVQPVSPRFVNAVTLRGHVAQPLRHAWYPGMRVSDLLPSSEALVSPVYWVSRHEKNAVVRLLRRDPDTAIDTDFPDINWEYAVIERVDPLTLTTELLPFRLDSAVNQRDPEHDLQLQPGDQLTVFSLKDFRTRIAQKPHFIRIEGEVQRAGFYAVRPDETIAELIARSGGVTPNAYLYGLEIRRESLKRQQRLRIDESIDQLEQDYQRHLIDRSRNVLTGDLSLAITPEAAAIARLISRLREAEPTGRIVMELTGKVETPGELPALTLIDGDSIYVPPLPATVEVVGAVYRQGSFIYDEATFRHYIARAGVLPTADSRNIYLVRPDGSFSLAGRRVRVRPGDTIIVPEKVDRQRMVRRVKDWTQVLYQFGLGAAGLNLLGVF